MGLNIAFAVLVTVLATTNVIADADYPYPYHDPYLATATTAILNDNGATVPVESSIIRVAGLRGRNDLPYLKGRGDVSLALYRQKKPAPLLFILPGLGSNPYFGVAPYLASLYYREGFHVVVLPSPMSWNFAVSASRSGAPGYAPDDARDLYEVMQKTMALLRGRLNIKPLSVNFMAVSLGALEGAHLSIIDAEQRKIGIAKYLLINPPIDLAYAVKKIDEWNSLANQFSREQSQQIIAKAIAIVDSFAEERRDDPEVFDRLAKKFESFSREDLEFLIAENLQSQLAELIYVTQVIHDQKILTEPKNDKRKRLEEAKKFTIADYDQKIALPLWQKQKGDLQADLESFNQRGSITSIVDQLRNNPKVHVLHNADDFLAGRKSIEELKDALGDRMTLYPYGGHLGNLWFPENKKSALKFFRSPPPKEGFMAVHSVP
jgi:hypothetical protein